MGKSNGYRNAQSTALSQALQAAKVNNQGNI